MKFHIVQIGEDIDKICSLYNINKDILEKLNPTINSRNLIVGERLRVIEKEDKKIIEDITSIYTNNNEEDIDDEKYICPHCKNIILIPKNRL
jgi:murein DD-endopeptidase MepM/ murein hydrolase activator NlpD